ncbi:MAG: hypothetical protein JMN24_02010 [gamma proteobacterium endosymbiont of Lamellibrachia anaximandri]|nr:hypothetical protein [gamma proteobacterium endosymbiont of Lamellibrachia anaximandri]MBL3616337.1 hypothetical protein [gamma proteobacterium endosymbiont of Lamellibrachia anaximandri]
MLTQASLSLEQAPPFSVPIRFFLTAPLFLFLAGVVLMLFGADALTFRWSPVTLALTHLFTLGFLGLVMVGAMMQMLPVLAGSPVPGVLWISTLAHLLLTIGVSSLVIGFTQDGKFWMPLAMVGLAGGFAVFGGGVAIALLKIKAPSPTVTAMRLAVSGLAVTVILGLLLTASLVWPLHLWQPLVLTNIHLSWGLLTWVGLLVLGVSYQVVPMFQLTPEYPVPMTRHLPRVLFMLVLLWSMLYPAGVMEWTPDWFAWGIVGAIGLGFSGFAWSTLQLQRKRRRKLPDVTLDFWRLGMLMLLAAFPVWMMRGLDHRFVLLLGVVMLVGFGLSVVNGMLYKIVPFLSWFHLQHRKMVHQGGVGPRIPTMKDFLPDTLARRQYRLHLLMLATLGAAVFFPEVLSHLAGSLLSLSALLLCYNLVHAVRRFRAVSIELDRVG